MTKAQKSVLKQIAENPGMRNPGKTGRERDAFEQVAHRLQGLGAIRIVDTATGDRTFQRQYYPT